MRSASHLSLWAALAVATSSMTLSGCGDDEKARNVNVTHACNRLEDLAGVVLSVRSATTAQEVQSAIDEPLEAFVTAADQSGDGSLAELAHTYDSRFSAYVQGDSEAGSAADMALDLAGARCTELGAANVFPQQS